jgi:hypothetical protein
MARVHPMHPLYKFEQFSSPRRSRVIENLCVACYIAVPRTVYPGDFFVVLKRSQNLHITEIPQDLLRILRRYVDFLVRTCYT